MHSVIDCASLPPLFPTHGHAPEFWEQLGRAVATFGFLEEVLGKAIFALTATRQYHPDQIDAAYKEWLPKLERALTDQLWKLAESFGNAARDNPSVATDSIEALVARIKDATIIRNVLCHGSWRTPGANGASVPMFVRRDQVFETAIDVVFLKQVQTHVAELTCHVMNTVTLLGWQFPGSSGPGRPIMPKP